jgi:hypothetical protein
MLDPAGVLPPGGERPVHNRLGGGELVDDPAEVDARCDGPGERSGATQGQPAQRGDRSPAEAAVDSSAGGELGGEDLALPQSGGDCHPGPPGRHPASARRSTASKFGPGRNPPPAVADAAIVAGAAINAAVAALPGLPVVEGGEGLDLERVLNGTG